MDTVNISKLINHDLYAKGNVNGYDSTLKTVTKTFRSGNYIGKIYSYIVRDGNIYYMLYLSDYDYNNFKPTFILHDPAIIDVPDLREILQQIKNEKETAAIKEQGAVQYYTSKYLPYLIGAIVLAIALPTIIKSFKNGK
jgi:hypothetical protein